MRQYLFQDLTNSIFLTNPESVQSERGGDKRTFSYISSEQLVTLASLSDSKQRYCDRGSP